MLSRADIELPQRGQALAGLTTERPSGIRWATTFTNEPATSPVITARRMRKGCKVGSASASIGKACIAACDSDGWKRWRAAGGPPSIAIALRLTGGLPAGRGQSCNGGVRARCQWDVPLRGARSGAAGDVAKHEGRPACRHAGQADHLIIGGVDGRENVSP